MRLFSSVGFAVLALGLLLVAFFDGFNLVALVWGLNCSLASVIVGFNLFDLGA
jgi:hypothetical protein